MVLLKGLFIASLFCMFEYYSEAKISDKRLCANFACDLLISKGITTQKYAANDPHLLHFEEGADVEVYSKGAGSRKDLWGVKINGKRGFVSKQFIKETQVFIRDLNFTLPSQPHQEQEAVGPPKVSNDDITSEESQNFPTTKEEDERPLESSLKEETMSVAPTTSLPPLPPTEKRYTVIDQTTLPAEEYEEDSTMPSTSINKPSKYESSKMHKIPYQSNLQSAVKQVQQSKEPPSSNNLYIEATESAQPPRSDSIEEISIEENKEDSLEYSVYNVSENPIILESKHPDASASSEEKEPNSEISTEHLEPSSPPSINSYDTLERSKEIVSSLPDIHSLEYSVYNVSENPIILESKHPDVSASSEEKEPNSEISTEHLEPSSPPSINSYDTLEMSKEIVSSLPDIHSSLNDSNELLYKDENASISKENEEASEDKETNSQSFTIRTTLSISEGDKKPPDEDKPFDIKDDDQDEKSDLDSSNQTDKVGSYEQENEAKVIEDELGELENVTESVEEDLVENIQSDSASQSDASIEKASPNFILDSSKATPLSPLSSNALASSVPLKDTSSDLLKVDEVKPESPDSNSNKISPKESASDPIAQVDVFSESYSLSSTIEPSPSFVDTHLDSNIASKPSEMAKEVAADLGSPSENAIRPDNLEGSKNNVDTSEPLNADYTILTKEDNGLSDDNVSVPIFIYFLGHFEALLDMLPESLRLMLLDTRVSPHLLVFSVAFTAFSIFVSLAFIAFDRRGEVQRLSGLLCASEQKYFTLLVERDSYKGEVEAYKAKVSSLSTNFQNIKQPLTKEVETYKNQVTELQSAINSLSSENHTLKMQHEGLQQQHNELQFLNQKLLSELEDATTKLKDTETDLQIVSQTRLDLETRYEEQQMELATLQSKYEALRDEASIWEQRAGELVLKYEDCKTLISHLKGNLEHKEAEVKSMKELVELLKENPVAGQGDQAELEEKLNKLLDVSLLKEKIAELETEKESLVSKMCENSATIKELEEKVNRLQSDLSQAQQDYNQALQDRTEACTKLEVLTTYFKEKEVQLQKELGLQQSMRHQKETDASYAHRNIELLEEENASYKSQLASMKQELDTSQRKHKAELVEEQKKVHDSWINLRNTQRKLEEAQKEAAGLRQRLTTLEKEHALKLKNALEEYKKSPPISDPTKIASNPSASTPRSGDSIDAAIDATMHHPSASGPSPNPNLPHVLDPTQYNPHFKPHLPPPPPHFFDERMAPPHPPPPPFFGEHMPPPRFPGGPGSPAEMWRFPAPMPPPFPQPSYSYDPPPIKPHFDERRSQRWRDRPRDHKEEPHYPNPQGERQASTPTRHPKHPENSLHRQTPPTNSPVPQDNRRDISVNMDVQPKLSSESKSPAFEPYPPKDRGFSQSSTFSPMSPHARKHSPTKVPPPQNVSAADMRATSFNFSGPKMQKPHIKDHTDVETYSRSQKPGARQPPPKEDSMV